MGEFEKLVQLLTEHNIPHVVVANCPFATKSSNGEKWKQILYPTDNPDELISDVVCHYGSYGHEEGLLEQMGLTEYYGPEYIGDVKGWLTAEEVFECWIEHYENRKENENE